MWLLLVEAGTHTHTHTHTHTLTTHITEACAFIMIPKQRTILINVVLVIPYNLDAVPITDALTADCVQVASMLSGHR